MMVPSSVEAASFAMFFRGRHVGAVRRLNVLPSVISIWPIRSSSGSLTRSFRPRLIVAVVSPIGARRALPIDPVGEDSLITAVTRSRVARCRRAGLPAGAAIEALPAIMPFRRI